MLLHLTNSWTNNGDIDNQFHDRIHQLPLLCISSTSPAAQATVTKEIYTSFSVWANIMLWFGNYSINHLLCNPSTDCCLSRKPLCDGLTNSHAASAVAPIDTDFYSNMYLYKLIHHISQFRLKIAVFNHHNGTWKCFFQDGEAQ